MPLPGDLETVTVTGSFIDCAGQAQPGWVTFTPSEAVSDATGQVVIPARGRGYPLTSGSFSAVLVATDSAGLSPAGFTYLVTVAVSGLLPWSFTTLIPHAPSPVDLSALK